MGQQLLISNPPHPRVDAQVAATVLGLPAVDANLKARYSIPEIWLADPDAGVVAEAARTLEAAGMRAVTIDGEELLRVPAQRLLHGFTFAEPGFHLQLKDSQGAIAADRPCLIVTCTPRAQDPGAATRAVEGRPVVDSSAFIDLYVPGRERWARVAAFAELTDFGGLGAQRAPSQSRNLQQLGQQLRSSMQNACFDDRLVNMQLRRRPGYGTPPQLQELRRGYSYAAPGLAALLESISPELRDISQAELSSRLCYLTFRVRSTF